MRLFLALLRVYKRRKCMKRRREDHKKVSNKTTTIIISGTVNGEIKLQA